MKKAFIPSAYRPCVPGSKLKSLNLDADRLSFKKAPLYCVFVIGAKDDIVPYHLLKEVELKETTGQLLYYDELGITWDFSFSNGILKIHFKECMIIPSAIYHRHPGVTKEHPYYHKHIALFEVLDIWKGNLIGQKRDHYHNSSKAYQGITSISHAAKLIGNQKVKYPRSFFLKGDFCLLKSRFGSSLVVKSAVLNN